MGEALQRTRAVIGETSPLQIVGVTLVFKLLIEFVYVDFLSRDIYFPLDPDPFKYIVGLGLTLGLVFLLHIQTRNRPMARVATSIFFVFLVAPILSYFSIADRSWVYAGLVIASFLVTLQFTRLPLLDVEQRDPFTARTTSVVVGLVLVHTAVMYVAMVAWYGSPPLSPLFFEDTYEIRGAIGPILPSIKLLGSPLFGYMLNWQIKVWNPFLIGFFFKKGWYRTSAGVCGLAVLGYMYVPNTLYLATPVFVLSILLLFRYRRVTTGIMTVGVVGIVLAYLPYHLEGIIKPIYQVVGRLMYVEARNEFFFFQWFQTNPHMYLTDSPLNPFWEYPYQQKVTFLYSDRFLGNPHNANVGYPADGYGQFGALGTLAAGVAVGAVLWVLDSFARNSDPEMVVVVAATPLFNLTQSDLTSSILTNGVLLVVGLAFVYATDDVGAGSVSSGVIDGD